MTGLAHVAGDGVGGRLTGGGNTVMAIDTGTNQLIMIQIDNEHRLPGHGTGRMTLAAGVTGLQMVRGLATGNIAVMTTDATTNHLQMVHPLRRHRRKTCRPLIMAGLTGFAGGDMRCGFTRGNDAVVTLRATVDEGAVIQVCDFETDDGMAATAIFAGVRMPRHLPAGPYIIMTTAARTQRLIMMNGTGPGS